MKKVILSIFILCAVGLASIILMLTLKTTKVKGTNEVIATPNHTVTLNVQASETIVVGEQKQLFVTVFPLDSIVVIEIDNNNIVSVNSKFILSGFASGNATCTVSATSKGVVETKNVTIKVEERQLLFETPNDIFYYGQKQDGNLDNYSISIFSNFALKNIDMLVSENVVITNILQDTIADAQYFYIAEISFYINVGDTFKFVIDEFVFESPCLQRANLLLEFEEEDVYNQNTNTLTLYSNISDIELAAQDNVFASASIKNNLTDFNVSIDNTEILSYENNLIVAKKTGLANFKILSKTDNTFIIEIKVVVKELLVQNFDVFVNDQEFLESEIEAKIGDVLHFEVMNIVPSYINTEGIILFNFSTENQLIEYNQDLHTISVGDYGQANLEIAVCQLEKRNFIITCNQSQENTEPENKDFKLVFEFENVNYELENKIYEFKNNEVASINLPSGSGIVISTRLFLNNNQVCNDEIKLINAKLFGASEEYYYLNGDYIYISITNSVILEFKFEDIVFEVEFLPNA
jgi:hypothetical protein